MYIYMYINCFAYIDILMICTYLFPLLNLIIIWKHITFWNQINNFKVIRNRKPIERRRFRSLFENTNCFYYNDFFSGYPILAFNEQLFRFLYLFFLFTLRRFFLTNVNKKAYWTTGRKKIFPHFIRSSNLLLC